MTYSLEDRVREAHARLAKAIARQPSLLALSHVATAFRRLNAQLPIQQLAVLVEIALNPGITATELGRRLDMLQSSVSRNVHALSTTHRSGKRGLRLVEQYADPTDDRRFCLHLTSDGQDYVLRVISIMEKCRKAEA